MTDKTPMYAVGELVDVTIRGVRVTGTLPTRPNWPLPEIVLALDEHAGQEFTVTLPLVAGVTVERTVPADGEPQPGDLWRDGNGELYFARIERSHPGVVLVDTSVIKSGRHYHQWREVHARSGLTLVHREPQPADTEGDES
jgi:hypothetical protein